MYVVFDTETTGLPLDYNAPVSRLANWPRMVQLAWSIYDEEEKHVSSHCYIIKPRGFVIPYNAEKIHGISTKTAMEDGIALRTGLKRFSAAIKHSKFLVAHNMAFDEKIIGAEFLRENLPNGLSDKKRICTMKSSTDFCRLPGYNGYKWPKLSELHQILFGKPLTKSHRADIDVKACARCFFELKRLGIVKIRRS